MNRPSRVSSQPSLLLIDVWQRDLYGVALRQDFYILTALPGSDGLSVAMAERPDVIVVDVMMSGLTGWETCTRLKCETETADIPVILLTGATHLDLSRHAAAVGASAILKKPCSVETLRSAIFAALMASASYSPPYAKRSTNREFRRVVPIR